MGARLGTITLFASVAAIGLLGPSVPAGAVTSPAIQTDCTSITLVGSAVCSSGTVRLTPATPWQVGAAWLTDQVDVASGFAVTFALKITGGDGDGVAFVVQNSSVSAIGSAGGYLGYADDPGTPEADGIANSIAVEFDTWLNPDFGDPNDNHISVHTRGTELNDANETYSLGWTTAIPNLSNGKVHSFVVKYMPGTLTVSGGGKTLLSISVDLSALLTLNEGKAWIGFTSATAVQSENHYVRFTRS